MVDDERLSRSPVSDTARIVAGDDGDNEVLDARGSETVSLDFLKVEYHSDGSTPTTVTLLDKSSDEGQFGNDDGFDELILEPGERAVITEATYDDIQNGVVATADGNNDALVIVTVGGMKITG